MANLQIGSLQKQLAIEQHSRQAAEFAERYTGSQALENCFAYSRSRLDSLLERYLPEIGAGLKLLDLGCGTGHHLARMRSRGYDVAGVDGSEDMLAQARINNPGVTISKCDVESVPFDDATFDLVLCIEVLRYLPDSRPVIREAFRLLKPGGLCLMTATPLFNLNCYWLINRIANRLQTNRLVSLRQFFATSGGLLRTFGDAGFSTVSIHGVYSGPINWVERLSPRSAPAFLRRWEALDKAVADRPLLRAFSNMFLVAATRPGRGSR